ncbi:antibiotic biosynthesis monooxygenase [Patulibacter sp. NPDC049589]|uniref:antibiotic biosynthesis monooxygenase family protein n=1 Tax=Patulibacter sp. NPDC049589 TaxID=3154731 RepID=UPI0034316A6F
MSTPAPAGGPAPVVEHAVLRVRPRDAADFKGALAAGRRVLLRAGGCLGVRVLECIESPGDYVVEVEWTTLERHTVDFASSPLLAEWRSHVARYLVAAPVVRHYAEVGIREDS